jgi:ribonuclease E
VRPLPGAEAQNPGPRLLSWPSKRAAAAAEAERNRQEALTVVDGRRASNRYSARSAAPGSTRTASTVIVRTPEHAYTPPATAELRTTASARPLPPPPVQAQAAPAWEPPARLPRSSHDAPAPKLARPTPHPVQPQPAPVQAQTAAAPRVQIMPPVAVIPTPVSDPEWAVREELMRRPPAPPAEAKRTPPPSAAKAEPKPVAKTEPKPVAVAEPKLAPKAEPKAVVAAAPKPAPEAEPKAVAKVEPAKPATVAAPKTAKASANAAKATLETKAAAVPAVPVVAGTATANAAPREPWRTRGAEGAPRVYSLHRQFGLTPDQAKAAAPSGPATETLPSGFFMAAAPNEADEDEVHDPAQEAVEGRNAETQAQREVRKNKKTRRK